MSFFVIKFSIDLKCFLRYNTLVLEECMELDIIKKNGQGTVHQLDSQAVSTPLPPRDGKITSRQVKHRILPNIWYDQLGIRYEYLENDKVLRISHNNFYPDSILSYVNSIPTNLDISIVFGFGHNKAIAELNSLLNSASRIYTNKPIIISVFAMKFGERTNLEIENLPNNVKLSNVIHNTGLETTFHGENSLDWWGLKLPENDFRLYLTKLTPKAKERAIKLREIALNTYIYLSKYNISNLSIEEKGKLVFDWCMGRIDNGKGRITYDFENILPDGRLDMGFEECRDAIETFKRKKGVCAGRARLLKVMLNNNYMRVPCYLVNGMSGHLQHEWNEIITEDGKSIMYDMSQQTNVYDVTHEDYKLSRVLTRSSQIQLPARRLPKIQDNSNK
jgi:hypothetical protein